MQESGLGRRHDEFYLIDPGITNGTDESTEVFEIFHEDFNLSYFGNNCIAWQKADDGSGGKQVFVKINWSFFLFSINFFTISKKWVRGVSVGFCGNFSSKKYDLNFNN